MCVDWRTERTTKTWAPVISRLHSKKQECTLLEWSLVPSEVFQAAPEVQKEKENEANEPEDASNSQATSTGDNVCDGDAEATKTRMNAQKSDLKWRKLDK